MRRGVYEEHSMKWHKTVPAKSSVHTKTLILGFWLPGFHRVFTAGLPQPNHDSRAKTASALLTLLMPSASLGRKKQSFSLHPCVKDGPQEHDNTTHSRV